MITQSASDPIENALHRAGRSRQIDVEDATAKQFLPRSEPVGVTVVTTTGIG